MVLRILNFIHRKGWKVTMKHRKRIIGIAATALAVITGYVLLITSGVMRRDGADLVPRLGESTASAEFLNAQKAAAYYREEVDAKPDVIKNYVQLAQLFLQEARITGNHHVYVPKASALLDEALRRAPEDFEATIIKASMLMTLHQFAEARKLAEWAVAKNPHSAYARGVLVDALVESGAYDQAVASCDQLLALRPDLRSYARASYLRELHGEMQGAAEAMKLAADAGVTGQENRAWALYNLGKLYFTVGKLDTAAFIFNGILEERSTYAYAMSGLAQVACARGRNDEAIRLLTRAAELSPQHLFLEQLADMYAATGETDAANGTAGIVLRMYEQHERGGWNIDREYALFCANHDMHLPDALERARRDYERRPDNIDALDTYAWTLYKNGNPSEAARYSDASLRLGTRNPMFFYHAGMIHYQLGQWQMASALLEQATSMNPWFNPLYAESAQATMRSLRQLAAR